jgi:feruloyl-CoA synthase
MAKQKKSENNKNILIDKKAVITPTTQGKFKMVNTIMVDIRQEDRLDGSVVLRSSIPLDPHPFRLTDRFVHWAKAAPDRIFIGRKNKEGRWIEFRYGEAYKLVQHLAQAILDMNLPVEKPIAILSENSIEHALLSLAAMHVGIPYSAIAPAYSLRSSDFNKLKQVMELLDPGVIFVDDAKKYETAIRSLGKNLDVISLSRSSSAFNIILFDDLLRKPVTDDVEKAFQSIQPGTIAKILFTSGSTDLPKGVINTHGNISANWQQITQTFPFLQDEGLEFVDWLPWNHTFGGNHNFGLAIYNGGSFYIDDGNPTPEGIGSTVGNLRERTPTIYFNVPKGFEELIPHFIKDVALRKKFFSRLKMLFYAGAGMPQHVWDAWEQLSMVTIGEKILIGTGLGCTESCPSALFASEPGGYAGLLGVPVPGLELKLVPTGNKYEARYRGDNIFPGYWKQPELTAVAFDEEGFYRTGDALRFVDHKDPNKGLLFDGRFAEDFKLTSGTWVRVGILRSEAIAAGQGLIQDIVITGHDRDFIGAIIFPGIPAWRKLTGMSTIRNAAELAQVKDSHDIIQKILSDLAKKRKGSASMIRKALIADFELSMDKGEITDKGSVNQKAVIANHPDVLEKLYSKKSFDSIIEVKTDFSGNGTNL